MGKIYLICSVNLAGVVADNNTTEGKREDGEFRMRFNKICVLVFVNYMNDCTPDTFVPVLLPVLVQMGTVHFPHHGFNETCLIDEVLP